MVQDGEPFQTFDVDAELGRRLRLRREALGLVLPVVADTIGVREDDLNGFEGGMVRPPTGVLVRLCRALSLPMADLFSRHSPADGGTPVVADPLALSAETVADRSDTVADLSSGTGEKTGPAAPFAPPDPTPPEPDALPAGAPLPPEAASAPPSAAAGDHRSEAVALVHAFLSISNPAARRHLLDLVKSLAAEERDP